MRDWDTEVMADMADMALELGISPTTVATVAMAAMEAMEATVAMASAGAIIDDKG